MLRHFKIHTLHVPQIRIMSDASSKGDEAVDTYDDAFLKKIEMGMLSQISLQVCQFPGVIQMVDRYMHTFHCYLSNKSHVM